MIKTFVLTFLVLLLASFSLFADPSFGIAQITLKNGMKVWLKPTQDEEDEVSLRMIAEGGYSLLPEDQRGSGEMATQVAFESGLGDLSSDQLSVLLYEESVEFNARILPFSREIEGGSRRGSLPTLLNIIRKYFMEQRFTKEAFNTVVRQNKEALKARGEDHKTYFEDNFKILNTQNYHFLKPFKLKYVENAELETIKDFFEFAFANPADFVCVIVGDFNQEEIVKVLEETLGSIPKKKPKMTLIKPTLPTFPNGVTTKVITYPGRNDSLARMTFPMTRPMEETLVHPFTVGIQILELRIREMLTKKFQSSQSVNVTYELPLYPMLAFPWVVVQYRTEPKKVAQVQDLIIQTIRTFMEKGPTDEEVQMMENIITRNEEYWLKDNDFWLGSLTNHAIWGWSSQGVIVHHEKMDRLSPQQVKKVIEAYLKSDNYTWIYTQP